MPNNENTLSMRVSAVVDQDRRKPEVSVVVVLHNIPREAPRTLFSLSALYQRHIDADDYEIIVVDNGSNPPVDPNVIGALAGNFRLIRIDAALPSPAQAMNRGIAAANGDTIGVMVDGARIVTPGLLHFARHGARIYQWPVVATLGWYLGYDFQRWAMRSGYDHTREDALLAQIRWPEDGYRLFEIATLDESSVDGWLRTIAESNALFMRRETWDALGGLDERFDLPGGGLVNLDTFRRAVELPGAELVLLLGEATFHQLHGGVSTNRPVEEAHAGWVKEAAQYEKIRGYPYELPRLKGAPTYLGTLPRPALARFARAVVDPAPGSGDPPLGRDFERELWSLAPPTHPADGTVAALVELAQDEFRGRRYEAAAAVARLARERAPDEPEPQRLLALVSAWLPTGAPPRERRAEYHVALGDAYRLLRETDLAASNYRAALGFDCGFSRAQAGLVKLGISHDPR